LFWWSWIIFSVPLVAIISADTCCYANDWVPPIREPPPIFINDEELSSSPTLLNESADILWVFNSSLA
jgi:hypothetical protein